MSEEEIIKILNATENLKHKAILMTIYSAGLRISELVNLKIKDIDSERMQIRVAQAKGKKDRYTLLGEKTLEILRKYVSEYKPKNWLFEGMKGEQWQKTVFDFYTFEGSLALRNKLREWDGGRIVVHITEMPIKCPVAPLEFAFLADLISRIKICVKGLTLHM